MHDPLHLLRTHGGVEADAVEEPAGCDVPGAHARGALRVDEELHVELAGDHAQPRKRGAQDRSK